MNKPSNHFSDDTRMLKTVLDQQQIYLLKMLAILHQEHQALDDNNLEQFEDIVQRKIQQVKNLEEIQPQLSSVERIIGGVLSKSTFSAFIQRMPNSTEKSDLVVLWNNFQETLAECDLQNKINNRTMNASAINTKQALSILQGNTEPLTQDIYSESGLQQDKLQGQPLAIV